MKYQMLLWPHANARYRAETIRLAASELRIMLDVLCPQAQIIASDNISMPSLMIETPNPLEDHVIRALGRHSLMYVLYECEAEQLLRPIAGRSEDHLGDDLPAILKYKGKTNELFIKMLINVCAYASDYACTAETIELLDPMCGRGTSVFTAANFGWNATGSDIDKNDLSEAEKFLKRYLEYHKVKYSLQKESRTLKAAKAVPVTNYVYARTAEAMKRRDTRVMRFAETDAGRIADVFGRNAFHVIVCDLPYGVQHAPDKGGFTDLMKHVLPAWREALKPGGAAAVSFNIKTLAKDQLKQIMRDAGFTVLSGGAYDGFEHWVEQAVTRDIVIVKK